MAKEINATRYMEVCSKTGEGINQVFTEAVNQVLKDREDVSSSNDNNNSNNKGGNDKKGGKGKKKNSQCVLL